MQKAAAIILLTAGCCFMSRAQDQTPAPAAAPASAPHAPQTPAPAAPAASSANETAEALARKYIGLWNTGDTSAINSFPDFIMHNHGGRVVVGPGMLGRVIAAWRKSMPDLKFTIDDLVAEGDKVVIRVTLKGTYKELLFPEASDPQSPPRLVRATGLLMFKVKDGKIHEIWQELDEGALRVQMGAQWKTRQELAAQAAASRPKKQDESPANTPPPKP